MEIRSILSDELQSYGIDSVSTKQNTKQQTKELQLMVNTSQDINS